MEEKELNKYYWLNKEVKDLEERINELGDGVGSMKYTDMIKGKGGKSLSVEEKVVELKNLWIEKRITALEEYIKIENYISNIEDVEVRQIMRYRYMDLKTWEEIGKLMNFDRTVVAKKCRKYIKKQVAQKTH